MRKILLILMITCLSQLNAREKNLFRIGIVGLTHTHVHWIFNSAKEGGFEIAGIVEPDEDLARRYINQYNLTMDLVYESIDEMIKAVNPEGVTAFGTIYEHLEIVEKCAPLGIHVMVEKPLAVNIHHAQKMQSLAAEHGIHLLTNYETTWYPANHMAYQLVQEQKVGPIRKVIIYDGHKGPKKLDINKEFLDWLTDPELNGGGAITDFGCYGANLMTWLTEGEKPLSVTAVTQQLQPENNPKVDDEANIILTYNNATAIIQASWNWPIGRKDMEIYGLSGTIDAENRNDIRIRLAKGYDDYDEEFKTLEELKAPYNDPFVYFAAVVRGEISPKPYDLSSLENNMIVMEILDAAIRSAETHKTIFLDK